MAPTAAARGTLPSTTCAHALCCVGRAGSPPTRRLPAAQEPRWADPSPLALLPPVSQSLAATAVWGAVGVAASGTTWSPAPTSWATPVPEPRTPRTAASCNLGPARQRWGRRPRASSSPHAHPLPACHGRGVEAKEKYPFGFFLLRFVFFLREVIFYSVFILKEKHKQKKKKKSIYLNALFLFPASMKLRISLKTKEGFFLEPRDRGAFTEPSFCFSALPAASPALPPSRTPRTWCLRGRCGFFSASLQGRRAESGPWATPLVQCPWLRRLCLPAYPQSHPCPSQVPAVLAFSVLYIDKRWG